MSNPLSAVYAKLWDAAEAHPVLAALSTANKIKFETRQPIREQLQSADVPELMLVTVGGTSSLSSSSSSTRLTKRFDWVLTTGDMRLDEVMFPLSWALLEAMVASRMPLFALTWGGATYVKRVQEMQIREGESESARRTNVRGWTAVQSIEVEMHFHTATLISAATQD
jgi:hypothetical protein